MMAVESAAIKNALQEGSVIPYLGPGVLALNAANASVPSSPESLVQRLVAKASVPHKIRNNLTAAAQFVENFKHRKTLVGIMNEAFSVAAQATQLQRFLAALNSSPMIVDVWYDNAMAAALGDCFGNSKSAPWGQVQGLSQSEHFGRWTQAYRADSTPVDDTDIGQWQTLLYKPLGGVAPAKNYLVSDTDFVEVLTEIDIQTPIPSAVQQRRSGRSFLFLGCRFANQLERTFARQIMKRSSAKHWAVLPDALTKNERRFLAEQNIQRIEMPLEEFAATLTQVQENPTQRQVVNC
ncbi:MAG: SIR2 family protein [Pseudomonadota bacterium]